MQTTTPHRNDYNTIPIPRRLLDDQHESPLAIGLYILLARQYLITQTPIPLSANDIILLDPTLSRGAVLRALERLSTSGWVIKQTPQRGCKARYIPTWGRVKPKRPHQHATSTPPAPTPDPIPWTIGARALGRPKNIHTSRVEKKHLDDGLGRLAPHATARAHITRYDGAPTGSLRDIGQHVLGTVRIAPKPGTPRPRGRQVPAPRQTPRSTRGAINRNIAPQWGHEHHNMAQ